MTRLRWAPILERAAMIVQSYDTGVTLRQLFYRLVAEEVIPNRQTTYKALSRETAQARRDGWFPDLFDRTRAIHRAQTFTSPDDARQWLKDRYRRDRTEGQPFAVYLAVEKHGLVEQLRDWFGGYGVPILSLGGYSSQTYVDEVRADLERQLFPDDALDTYKQLAREWVAESGGYEAAKANIIAGLLGEVLQETTAPDPPTATRQAVLLYGGDFDPSGEDIPRDFLERVEDETQHLLFDHSRRVALTAEQVTGYDLPPQMGKAADPRASQFIAKHGRLVQVELDALPPDVLRSLYQSALDEFVDVSTFEAVLEQEQTERESL